LPPNFRSKIGSKEPKNRLKLFIRIGSLTDFPSPAAEKVTAALPLKEKRAGQAFIFNSVASKRFFRYSALLICGFYLFLFVSVFLFIFDPVMFYFRSWEFFDDIVFHSPNRQIIWDAPEKGDLSRKHFFRHQESWRNFVSCDADGFRSVPFQAESYPILVVGDCQTWGTALSDNQTIPWKLAEALNIPVYNAGRVPFTLTKVIKHSRFSQTKLVVEIVTAHLINQDLFSEPFRVEEYQPLMKEEIHPIFSATPRRYFLPYKWLHFFSLKNLLSLFPIQSDREAFVENKTDEVMEIAIDNICKRARGLQQMGMQYLFIPIPQPYYAKCSDAEYKGLGSIAEWYTKLIGKLKERNIHAISFDSLFREHGAKLFFESDSHINEYAVDLMVSEISRYIRENGVLFENH
jgi:hypothetical protein